VAKPVELARGDAGGNERGDVVEHFARQSAGDAHLRDVVFVFECDSHESGLKCDLFPDYRTIWHSAAVFWRPARASGEPVVTGPAALAENR